MDIDIDLKTNFKPKEHFKTAVLASMMKDGQLVKHPCGTYFQSIAKDPFTECAAIPHKEAQDLGYFKIDFLHISVLDAFETKAEIRALMRKKPDWSLLRSQEQVEKLFHIKNHFGLINRLKPKNVQELADAIALIRPGRRELVDDYLQNKEHVREKYLYVRNAQDEYSFKKGHAIAYAFNIILQLHLIKEGKL